MENYERGWIISVPAICDYVTLMETNEIYDGYRTIYQQYFADEGCDFMISYGANGNSRVILNENEEIIEYLVYDRLSRMKNANYMFYTEVRKTQMVHGISQRRRSLIYLHIVCLQKTWSVVVKHHGQRLEVKSLK